MLNALIGQKIDQSQRFTDVGKRIPVTRIAVESPVVVGIKTTAKDGYNAIVLGIGIRRPSTLTQADIGKVKKAGLEKNPPRFLREIKLSNDFDGIEEKFKPGTKVKPTDVFKVGDTISVQGISKGKGFQGGVKRHHFAGGPRTHGQSDRERAPGAIGQTTTPGRVYKGKRMAGRMGSDTVTVKNLKVIAVEEKTNQLIVSGLVPGGRNSLLFIKKMGN